MAVGATIGMASVCRPGLGGQAVMYRRSGRLARGVGHQGRMRVFAATGDLPSRRDAIAGVAMGLVLGGLAGVPRESSAATFYGAGKCPTCYLQTDAISNKDAAYTFEYPDEMRGVTVGKVESGFSGVDAKVVNPKLPSPRGELIEVVSPPGARLEGSTLSNPNELPGIISLASVELQEFLQEGPKIKYSSRTDEQERTYYDFDMETPGTHYLISAAISLDGRFFALIISCPRARWGEVGSSLKNTWKSFHVNA